MTIAVAYLRVSKKDGSQTTENQTPEVEALALARGIALTQTYEDKESAAKRRPGLQAMLDAFRRRKFGPNPTLIIWSLDRLGRGVAAFDIYRELVRLNVKVLSCRESWLEQEGPTRELLAMLMTWISGFERSRLIERTKAGIERAKRNGVRLGRPPAKLDVEAALALRAQGLTLHQIGERLGCSHATVFRAIKGKLVLNEKGVENEGSQQGQIAQVG